MNKKKIVTIEIAILLISSVFIMMKITDKPEFGVCKINADCKLVRCIGAYCDNGKCKCLKIPKIKTETICTDGIDNDGDCLTDNEDGDCWIREGAVFMENYYRVISFNDYVETLPELKEIGITTIEMLPIWEHINSDNPTQRANVRDYSKLDHARGSEEELKAFVDKAHSNNIKVLSCMVEVNAGIPSSPVCGWNYDKEGLGGALYQYQMQNPEKSVLARDIDGNFVCSLAYGYLVDLTSDDTIEFFKDIYRQIQDYGFDGQRLDCPGTKSCKEGETVYPWTCEGKICPQPIDKEIIQMVYYRELIKLKKADEVFIAEYPCIEPLKSDWFCSYPYYSPDTIVDNIAEVSETPRFDELILMHIANNEPSGQLIEWIKNEPISHDRQRFRYISLWTRLNKNAANFITNDPRYSPLVTLVSTITGIPKVTDYELYGSKLADNHYEIQGDSVATSKVRRNHWKNILGIRNQSPALKYGTIENTWKSGDNTYAYSRTYEDENVIIIINFNDKQAASTLNIPFKKGDTLKDELSGQTFTVADPNNFQIFVPAYGSRILILSKKGVD